MRLHSPARPSRTSRRLPALAVAAVLLAVGAGCSDDDDSPSGDPTSSAPGDASTSPTPEATITSDAPADPPQVDPAAFCSTLSDDELAEITGRAQTVSDGTGSGYRTSCNSVRDVEDGLGLDWTRLGSPVRLEGELENARSLLDPVEEEVAGSTDAEVFAGRIAGTPMARVVTSYDGAVLVVEATDSAAVLGTDPVPRAELVAAAVGVAEAYLG
ncbi:hypothetical protein [Nocardioides dongxiaopingii]|uniref:hypothetical protein n=1 Tax=Nocardioides dongxiaopingii TaxID=2576036 RepID=UPI0010C76E42|nr:hypothetical protein [Nocardioides dongxiaopingii]